jgi:peptide/nickel transport system ATP-binding protein
MLAQPGGWNVFMTSAPPPLLEVEDLSVYHPLRAGIFQRAAGEVKAVDGVSFRISDGETLGLVGESGCGKSTLGRAVAGLTQPTGGRIRILGIDRASPGRETLKQLRRQVQIVFQDSVGSLNPRFRVRDILLEGRRIQRIDDGRSETDVVSDILGQVGLPFGLASRFPHELSGGQRQRIGIARALLLGPRLIVADEPVSALDVSVQSQVLNLLADLRRRFGLSYLFIAHNLAVVAYIADRIAVMYLGKIVELGPSEDVVARPLHPYTAALLSAVPDVGRSRGDARLRLSGEIPSAITPPSGCRFRTRCPIARDICAREEPPLISREASHRVACHFASELIPTPAPSATQRRERTTP